MRKLLAILGMITCMAALSACGSSEDTPALSAEEEQQLITAGEANVQALNQIVSAGAEEQYKGYGAIYDGLLSLKSAKEDIGDYVGTAGGTVELDKDETIVRINLNGTSHNAVVEMVLDSETSDFISIAVNVEYSLGEDMEKAALNTLLGMGTVFAVLILISLIISAFSLIPKLQKSKENKAENANEKHTDNVVAQIIEKEELSDDLELVAVISAAIAAYEGSGSTDGFVVRSIRKAHR